MNLLIDAARLLLALYLQSALPAASHAATAACSGLRALQRLR
jgi:hypothetical protein